MVNQFYGNKFITSMTLITLFIGLLLAIYVFDLVSNQIPVIAYVFMILGLVLAMIFAINTYFNFVTSFLLCTFCMLTAWRISGLYNITIVSLPLLFAFISLLLNFIYCAYTNMHSTMPIGLAEWQLIFIRLYIGFDFIPHFTEKLFAGYATRLADINAFTQLQVPHPDFFVWLAGLCEFGAAIALGLGFMMRLGAAGAFVYLLIATYLGHHFSLGFIWASAGGGWEFAVMWMMLILTFAITGVNTFSIDQELQKQFNIPKWIKKLM